jgi:hypothetical protein
MKNKLIIFAAMALLISSCSSHKIDDPLIIPPNFDEMPDLKNPDNTKPKSSDQDVEELRELLLKSNQ